MSPLRPHRQHGQFGFHESGKTRHETRFSLSLRRLRREQPQARPTGFHETRITRHETRLLCFHETRNTNHGFFSPSVRKGSTIRNPRSDCRPRRPAAAFLRVVARHRAARARHGRPPSPAPATRPVGFSPATRHATCFPPALRRLQAEQPQARPTGFSRNTRHESRPLCFSSHDFPRFPGISRYFPAPHPPGKGSASRSVAAFLRVVARHGAAMARHGRRPSPAPATRPVGFAPAARLATRFFPVPPATPRRATPSPAYGFFTNHETRNTNHGLYAFVAAFLRVVARHGAARARHGRPSSPAPAARPIGFSPATNHATCFPPALRRLQGEQPQAPANGFFTNHETRDTKHGFYGFHQPRDTQHVFPLPSGDSKQSNPKPGQRVFHETRDTNHGLYAFLPTISHDFPAFPAILRYPPSPRNRCPRAVRRRSRRPRDF